MIVEKLAFVRWTAASPSLRKPTFTRVARLEWRRTIWAICVFCGFIHTGSSAQTFTTLVNLNGANGSHPDTSLVQGFDGNLYGTTSSGGTEGHGIVFSLTSSGVLTTIYTFCSQTNCADGDYPHAPLTQAKNGNLYGTTNGGGANNLGTIFGITPEGVLTTLYSFCIQASCSDGEGPGALVQAIDGSFYGTTIAGGVNNGGTVFKITPTGAFTTLYTFCAQTNCPDGNAPAGPLAQAANGRFYGTTIGGGAHGHGTVFAITPNGTLTTIYSFRKGHDGFGPFTGVILSTDGNFYGTTESGGTNSAGTVFSVSPQGTYTLFHSFCQHPGCPDGAQPLTGLAQATDGNFYGTNNLGGANRDGTIFSLTSSGTLTALYSFCSQTNCADGSGPLASLVQATDGNIYGTTDGGGTSQDGTIFKLAVGLGAFIETLPTSGKIGAHVVILGTNLTGASGVSFNGTAAAFTVVSASEITTAVPAGATTGEVQVTTPAGTLWSNLVFHVIP